MTEINEMNMDSEQKEEIKLPYLELLLYHAVYVCREETGNDRGREEKNKQGEMKGGKRRRDAPYMRG